MAIPTTRVAPFRLSLRGMLVLVAAVALAIVSLTYASDWWQIGVVTLVLLTFAAAAIVALVDRGGRQAFALGMVVIMTIYAGLIAYASLQTAREFNPEFRGQGSLPTSRLLASVYERFVDRTYVDVRTGKRLMNFDPTNSPPIIRIQARRVETPPERQFMQIGHAWFALLLACLGGQFARSVYCRRAGTREDLR